MKRLEHFPRITLVLEPQHEVSKPEGFHLRLLSEPDVSVSTHPAPITQAGDRRPSFQCENSAGSRRAMLPSQYAGSCQGRDRTGTPGGAASWGPATVQCTPTKVRKLHQEGVSKSEIARRLSVSPNLSQTPSGALAHKNFRFLRSPLIAVQPLSALSLYVDRSVECPSSQRFFGAPLPS
jgi:hypothetical protein